MGGTAVFRRRFHSSAGSICAGRRSNRGPAVSGHLAFRLTCNSAPSWLPRWGQPNPVARANRGGYATCQLGAGAYPFNDLEAWCRKTAERLGGFSDQEKRVALDAFGVQVKVWRSDHTPKWEAEASIPLAAAAPTNCCQHVSSSWIQNALLLTHAPSQQQQNGCTTMDRSRRRPHDAVRLTRLIRATTMWCLPATTARARAQSGYYDRGSPDCRNGHCRAAQHRCTSAPRVGLQIGMGLRKRNGRLVLSDDQNCRACHVQSSLEAWERRAA